MAFLYEFFDSCELPVKMHAATEDKDITMRQIHRTCGSTVGVNRAIRLNTKLLKVDENDA
jgi:non-homologous end joining protein Ku